MSTILPFPVLADAARSWSVAHDGLSPAWAFAVFLVLTGLAAFTYVRLAGRASRGRLWGMGLLRLAACALLAALLTLPVLRLTESKPVRQPWAVLVDASQSMALPDRRESPEDLNRAAIAAGLAQGDLKTAPSGEVAAKVGGLTRMQIVEAIAANKKLDLWPRIGNQAELEFYSFGENLSHEGSSSFPALDAKQPLTALGDALGRLLKEQRNLGGVIVISDGGNNQGPLPIDAARLAKEHKLPLFLYGVGVASPPDIELLSLDHPSLAFVGERIQAKARVSLRGMGAKSLKVALKIDGADAGETEIAFDGDGEREATFDVVPPRAGELKLEVVAETDPAEVSGANNRIASILRVTDRKFDVLLIEQEPRWDFRYLLDYLQRDPRLKVRCAMIDGEPGLSQGSESTFLPSVPNTREGIFASQVMILGDVKPADLGRQRMEMIAEWVEAGGGIIFLAGSNYNPGAYAGTPLEKLLPVIPEASRQRREPSPFALELTPAGRRSPFLRMAVDDAESLRIWESFQGVRWVAPVTRAKPGAEVLLVDSRASTAGRYGKTPVFAMQGYGSGKCVYFGTDETYRWRSKTGQKYYSILWGQIMQSLSLQLLESASPLTQMKTDRARYSTGERVVISGKAYEAGYAPLMVPSLEGEVSVEGRQRPEPLLLTALDKNSFRGEFIPTVPGKYSFHTTRDPAGVISFEVLDANQEKLQTSLNDTLLKEMAAASGGKFLREEDLNGLPAMVSAAVSRVDIHRKVALYESPWILAALIALFSGEWLWRRRSRLK